MLSEQVEQPARLGLGGGQALFHLGHRESVGLRLALVGLVHPDSALSGVTGEALIRRAATLVGVHNYEGDDLAEALELVVALHGAGVEWDRLFSPPVSLARLPAAFDLAATGKWARVVVAP